MWKVGNTVRWLIHSVPRFPSNPKHQKKYQFPESAKKFGQSFLCIAAKYKGTRFPHALDRISEDLFYTWAPIYDFKASDADFTNFPKLKTVLEGGARGNHQPNNVEPKHHIQSFSGQSYYKGQVPTTFYVFSKTGGFGQDIYKDLMAPYLATKVSPRPGRLRMYVETWIRETKTNPRIRSDCSGETEVYNVLNIADLEKNDYPETLDHSKWAITNNGYVCIGGINRMTSQKKRGGSSVCLKVKALRDQIQNSIGDNYECCKNHQIGEEESVNCRERKYEEWQKSAANTIGNDQRYEFKIALICGLYLQRFYSL